MLDKTFTTILKKFCNAITYTLTFLGNVNNFTTAKRAASVPFQSQLDIQEQAVGSPKGPPLMFFQGILRL